MTTKTYKIGKNKGRPRIWLDGKNLTEARFVGGSEYWCYVRVGEILCVRRGEEYAVYRPTSAASGNWLREVLRKVTGRATGKPIIDMLGADVEAAFPGAERVSVTFEQGKITITRAA